MNADIINNPWIVATGSSVISGIIVFFLTTKLLTRKVDKEYIRKLDQANNEIFYSIRPSIADGKFPSLAVLNSIISAVAKKYELLEKELMNINDISNILIKEIMDNSFLSPDQKSKFCDSLLQFKTTRKVKDNKPLYKSREIKREVYYITLLGAGMAVFTSLVSFVISLPNFFEFVNFGFISLFLIPFIAIALSAIFSLFYSRKSRQREEETDRYIKDINNLKSKLDRF